MSIKSTAIDQGPEKNEATRDRVCPPTPAPAPAPVSAPPPPAPALTPVLTLTPEEQLQLLLKYISKYYEINTLKQAAIDHGIDTSSGKTMRGQEELFKLAGVTGEIYAQAGGKTIKSRNPVERIITEDEKVLILKYFPTIEKFDMGMKKIGYPLHVEKNGRGRKTRRSSLPKEWTYEKDGTTEKKSDKLVRLRRYGPDEESLLFTRKRPRDN